MGGKSKQFLWLKRRRLILKVVAFIIFCFLLVGICPDTGLFKFKTDQATKVENVSREVFNLLSRKAIDSPKKDLGQNSAIDSPKKDLKQNSASTDELPSQDVEIDPFSFITDNVDFLEVIQQAKSEGARVLEDLNIQAPISSDMYTDKICPTVIDVARNISHEPGVQYVTIPCGLEFGSVITIMGKPRQAQLRYNPLIYKEGLVSQFVIEIQGSKTRKVEEGPATILHLNPRLKGDWNGEPVIEHNSRYGQYRWLKAL